MTCCPHCGICINGISLLKMAWNDIQLLADSFLGAAPTSGPNALSSACHCLNSLAESSRLRQFLVLLAALRRSFFQKEEDRTRLLASMMQGTTAILASKVGLQAS